MRPVRKITNNPTKKARNTLSSGINIRTQVIKERVMAIPPSIGVEVLCNFLSAGQSAALIKNDNLINNGINIRTIIIAVINDNPAVVKFSDSMTFISLLIIHSASDMD